MSSRSNRNRVPRGFTLIEILVAAAVTGVLVTLLLGVSNNVLESHRRTVSGTTSDRDGHFALDRLVEDFSSLVLPRARGSEGFHAVVESVNGATSIRLMFVAVANDADPDGFSGTPRAICYQIAYQDPITSGGSRPAFALYRTVATATETLDDALAAENLVDAFWQSRPSADLEDFLVPDAVEFQIRYKDPWTKNWVDLENLGQSLRLSNAGYTNSDGNAGTELPPEIELSLTTISRDGATRLRNGDIQLDAAIHQFGKTFTRRICIPLN